MNKPDSDWVVPLIVVILLLGSVGVATAAVSSDFSSEYDGYNDGEQTDVRGHEIQSSGSLDFSGEDAVDVRITIKDAQHTVLDEEAVTLLQPGSTSVNFERRYVEEGVRYTADEVPAGTSINLELVTYPVSGLEQAEIKSAEVVVSYQRPSGDRTRDTFDINTELSNTAPEVISSQSQTGDSSERGPVDWALLALAGIGCLSILWILYAYVAGNGEPGDI